MSEKSWELTDEQKRKVYDSFVHEQESYFLKIMHYIYDMIIKEMLEEGKICEYGEFRARIKSKKSVLENDEKKPVDDVFGMEIITATEEEYNRIMEEIYEIMENMPENLKKPKDFDKENGYKAKHRYLVLQAKMLKTLGIPEEMYEYVPVIEIQFKTFNALIRNSAVHWKYKHENPEEIQERYDKFGFDPNELPIMWVSEHGKLIRLSEEETLRKMYPFLVLNRNKKRE